MINTDPTLKIKDIPDNSFVLLNPKVSVSDLNKTIVVVSINNEVLYKRYFNEKNTIVFISDNDQCSDMDKHLIPGEYIIIGEVVNIREFVMALE